MTGSEEKRMVDEETMKIAMEVLKQKHQNGDKDNIHRQYFEIKPGGKCPICDMTFAKHKKMTMESEIITQLANTAVEKMTSTDTKTYDPASAPTPTEVKCKECNKIELVGDSFVNGPQYKRIPSESEFICPACWWNKVGQNLV